jgi:hypothetical protein
VRGGAFSRAPTQTHGNRIAVKNGENGNHNNKSINVNAFSLRKTGGKEFFMG